MNAKFLKATTFVVLGWFASASIAQDDVEAPEVPAGPTPQEVAAQNMSDLLSLVKQGRSRAAERTVRASSDLHRTKQISSQSSVAQSASEPLKNVVQRVLKRSLKTMSC